jgi:hypothetical protein
MEIVMQEQIVPGWTIDSGIDFWEPDEFYRKWIAFLRGIWEDIEYL